MVYWLVLIYDTPLRIYPTLEQQTPVAASLCFTNRQLMLETAEVFYSKNTFIFLTPSSMRKFEMTIGLNKAAFVKHIEIETQLGLWESKFSRGWDPVWLGTFRASRMRNLERITITIEHFWFWAEVVEFSGLEDARKHYWSRDGREYRLQGHRFRGLSSTNGIL